MTDTETTEAIDRLISISQQLRSLAEEMERAAVRQQANELMDDLQDSVDAQAIVDVEGN